MFFEVIECRDVWILIKFFLMGVVSEFCEFVFVNLDCVGLKVVLYVFVFDDIDMFLKG